MIGVLLFLISVVIVVLLICLFWLWLWKTQDLVVYQPVWIYGFSPGSKVHDISSSVGLLTDDGELSIKPLDTQVGQSWNILTTGELRNIHTGRVISLNKEVLGMTGDGVKFTLKGPSENGVVYRFVTGNEALSLDVDIKPVLSENISSMSYSSDWIIALGTCQGMEQSEC